MGEEFVSVGLAQDVKIRLFDVRTVKQRKNAFIAEVDAIFRAHGGDKVVDGNNISSTNSQIFDLAVAFTYWQLRCCTR
jgi:hypothetical protein